MTFTQLPWFLRQFLLLLFFLLVSVVYTWPLCTALTTHIPGGTGDEYTNFWPFWYLPRALFSYDWSILHSYLQVYPDGFSMLYQAPGMVAALGLSLVSYWISPACAVNACVLLHIMFGCWFFYKVCRMYGAGPLASAAGAISYGYSPFLAAHVGGHYNLILVAYPAAALFFLTKLQAKARTPMPGLKDVLPSAGGLGISVWLVGVADLYLAVMTIALLIVFVAADFINAPSLLRVKALGQGGAISAMVAFFLAVPWMYALHKVNSSGDYGARFPYAGSEITSNPMAWVLPSPGHLLYFFDSKLLDLRKAADIKEPTYLGLIMLAFSPVAFLNRRNRITVCCLFGSLVVFLLLSLGNGYTVRATPNNLFNLGHYWPTTGVLSQFRVPARWHFAAVTVLAFLLAQGLQVVLSRKGRVFQIVAVLVIILASTDLWQGKLILRSTASDPWFTANPLTAKGSILAFPVGIVTGSAGGIGLVEGTQLLDQVQHQKPLLSGYTARLNNTVLDARKADKELSSILQMQADGNSPVPALDWQGFLNRYQIKYVLLPNGEFASNNALNTLIDKSFPVSETTQTANFKLITLR